MMTELEQSYSDMQDELIEAKRNFSDLKSEHDRIRKQFFEAGERYKTNMRAIHFMLTEVQSVGTHHEKEVVLRYIKQVIEKHLNKSVSYYPSEDDLPF